jgi:hypothetical protein
MGKRIWNIDSAKDYIRVLGYNLISQTYLNVDEKLILADEYGYYYFISLYSLKKGRKPLLVSKLNPYTIQNINLWIKLNYKNFELKSIEYIDSRDDLIFHCKECLEEFNMAWDLINQNLGCPYCSGQRVNNNNCLATNYPELASEWHSTLNGDLTPYDVTSKSGKSVWWQCLKNPKHIWESTIECRHIKKGRNNFGKCPYCQGKLASEDYNLLKDNPEVCEEWNYNKNNKSPNQYTVGSKKKVWWICKKCNNEWESNIVNRTNGRGCPQCNESKGEKKIADIFNLNKIYYISQKEFEGLLGMGNGNLSYDFYLPYNNILVEFQGLQHEKYVKGFHNTKYDFIKQQEHDKRKHEYAKNNNIRLLEIWYYDFDRIEEILEKELKIITKG